MVCFSVPQINFQHGIKHEGTFAECKRFPVESFYMCSQSQVHVPNFVWLLQGENLSILNAFEAAMLNLIALFWAE